ncbi:MAG: hypothetical protein M3O82_10555 [Verrucomicrobiota bacterium]|nr:hypothetical protein [Verrucomicrobiota bacterium]
MTLHLPAFQVLTVTADAASSGSVRRLAPPGSSGTYALQAISASSSLVLGPYTHDRQYEIVTTAGLLTSAIADAAREVPAATAIQPDTSPLILSALPTSDPAVVNQVWNDTGTLKLSAGP